MMVYNNFGYIKSLWIPKQYNRMDSIWPNIEPIIDHTYTNGTLFDGKPKNN